eukprot:6367459-Alexandrium_andersonii.AAC.1
MPKRGRLRGLEVEDDEHAAVEVPARKFVAERMLQVVARARIKVHAGEGPQQTQPVRQEIPAKLLMRPDIRALCVH